MVFPGPSDLALIREWCRTHRGSVAAIARMVVQHSGAVGINHSAVTRTLAGKERNSLVIEAYRKLRVLDKRQLRLDALKAAKIAALAAR